MSPVRKGQLCCASAIISFLVVLGLTLSTLDRLLAGRDWQCSPSHVSFKTCGVVIMMVETVSVCEQDSWSPSLLHNDESSSHGSFSLCLQ